MKTKKLTEQTEDLPSGVRSLPGEIRNNLLAAVVIDNIPRTLEMLSKKQAPNDKEKSRISKARSVFNYFKENPTELVQDNYALGVYNLAMKYGNDSIKQDLTDIHKDELMGNKQERSKLGRKLYNFYSHVSEEIKKRSKIENERDQVVESLNSILKLKEARN